MNNRRTLHIGNYRRIAPDQSVPLAPITIVFGPNSSGKSALLDAIDDLAMMFGTGRVNIFDENSDIHYYAKSFHTVAASNDTKRGIELGMTTEDGYGFKSTISEDESLSIIPKQIKLSVGHIFAMHFELIQEPDACETQYILVEDEAGPNWHGKTFPRPTTLLKCIVDGAALDSLYRDLYEATESDIPSHLLRLDHTIPFLRHYTGNELYNAHFNASYPWPEYLGIDLTDGVAFNFLNPSYCTMEEIRDYSGNIYFSSYNREKYVASSPLNQRDLFIRSLAFHLTTLCDMCFGVGAELVRTFRLPPMRIRPSRHVDPSYAFDSSWSNGGGEYYRSIRTIPHVRDAVNSWLERAGKPFSSYAFEVHNLIEEGFYKHTIAVDELPSTHGGSPLSSRSGYREQRLRILDRDAHSYVGLDEIGTGVSQVVPVIAALFTHHDSFLLIEQPELHLHPRLQARFADAVVDSLPCNNKVIIETHSEHLLLRLLNLVRSQQHIESIGRPLSPDDIQVLFVDGGALQSKIIPIDVLPSGNLSRPWPNGFFDEDYEGGV